MGQCNETRVRENMLRTAKLEEMLTEGEMAQPATEGTVQLLTVHVTKYSIQ